MENARWVTGDEEKVRWGRIVAVRAGGDAGQRAERKEREREREREARERGQKAESGSTRERRQRERTKHLRLNFVCF
jgi:hypothetical protein